MPGSVRAPRRSPRGGFTLIELLVVISIIALLIALLLPMLAQAREVARSSLCLSNQRQIAIAMALYQHDNADTYIPYNFRHLNDHVSPAFERSFWPGILSMKLNYLATIQAFDCPTFAQDYPLWQVRDAPPRASTSDAFSYSEYGYNSHWLGSSLRLFDNDDVRRFLTPRAGDIAAPSATYLLMDALDWDNVAIFMRGYYIVNDHNTNDYGPHARHHGGLNVAWADGHGSAMPIDDPIVPHDTLGRFTDQPNDWDRQ